MTVRGDMTVAQWVDMAAPIGADGLEFYAGFLELSDATRWPEFRKRVEDRGMSIPMLCCSPDFTHPDPAFRAEQVARLEVLPYEEGESRTVLEVLESGLCRTPRAPRAASCAATA